MAHIINVFPSSLSITVSGGAGERQARAQQKLFTMDVDEEENMSECLYTTHTHTRSNAHNCHYRQNEDDEEGIKHFAVFF